MNSIVAGAVFRPVLRKSRHSENYLSVLFQEVGLDLISAFIFCLLSLVGI